MRETWHIQSFVKIKPSRNAEITLSFTDVGNSCPGWEFVTLQILYVFLKLFAKSKFSQKLQNLQYVATSTKI